jgi:hypothetical protein
MRAQLSAELLIVLAIILAVVLLVATQLFKTATKASDKVDTQANAVFDKTEAEVAAALGNKGDPCSERFPCKEGLYCDADAAKCV